MTRETPPPDAAQPAAATPAAGVTVRVEAGREVVSADGWELSIWRDTGDGEPRIRDTDAAVKLGFAQARDIRKIIKRVWPEGGPAFRATVARNGPGRRPAGEYWLTEAELLKLCARSETPVAEAVLDEMIRVYLAVRRGLLAREKALPLDAAATAPLPAPVDPIPPRPAHPAGAILWDLHYGPKVSAASAREALPVVDGERVRLEVLVPTAVVTALLAHAGWDAVEFEGLVTIAATEGLWRFAEEVAGHKVARTERHQDSVRSGAVLFLLHKRAVDKGEVRLASEVRREALSPHPARPKRG